MPNKKEQWAIDLEKSLLIVYGAQFNTELLHEAITSFISLAYLPKKEAIDCFIAITLPKLFKA